jgi:protein-tyrosine phosphatase
MSHSKKQVVFVCSANYYRSRFAEHLFNWLAAARCPGWEADSRGLLVGDWGNIGPISRYAVEGLEARGISLNGHCRHPRQLTEEDLENADLTIAVKESEHRPLMGHLFPGWADRIEYWRIDDLDCAGPEEALPLLEDEVRALVERLRAPAA